jgi:hypothetical protein
MITIINKMCCRVCDCDRMIFLASLESREPSLEAKVYLISWKKSAARSWEKRQGIVAVVANID